MIVAIVGGKGRDKRPLVERTLNEIHRTQGPITKLITTAGWGVPAFAHTWARRNKISNVVYHVPAYMRRLHLCKIADRRRNKLMLDQQSPDLVLVFPGSRIADSMIDVARSNGVPYLRITHGGDQNPAQTFAREPDTGYNHIAFICDVVHSSDVSSGGPMLGTHNELLEQLCRSVNIETEHTLITSVFMEPTLHNRPKENFISRRAADLRGIKYSETLPPMTWYHNVYYLKGGLEYEIARLARELDKWRPRIIVTFGPIALWALTGSTWVGKYHGRRMLNQLTGYGFVLPTISLSQISYDKSKYALPEEVLLTARKAASIKYPRAIFDKYLASFD